MPFTSLASTPQLKLNTGENQHLPTDWHGERPPHIAVSVFCSSSRFAAPRYNVVRRCAVAASCRLLTRQEFSRIVPDLLIVALLGAALDQLLSVLALLRRRVGLQQVELAQRQRRTQTVLVHALLPQLDGLA